MYKVTSYNWEDNDSISFDITGDQFEMDKLRTCANPQYIKISSQTATIKSQFNTAHGKAFFKTINKITKNALKRYMNDKLTELQQFSQIPGVENDITNFKILLSALN